MRISLALVMALLLAHQVQAADTWFDALIARREAPPARAVSPKKVPLPDMGEDRYTIALWIRTDGDGVLFAKSPAEGAWAPGSKALFVRGGRLNFDIGWIGCVEGRRTIADGRWHHVVFCGGSPQRVYVDGVLDLEGDLERTPDVEGHLFKIGWAADDFPGEDRAFNGEIEEVQVYGRILTQEEIGAQAGATSAEPLAGLISRWPFDEGYDDEGGGLNDAEAQGRVGLAEGRFGKALSLRRSGRLVVRSFDDPAPDASLWRDLERTFADVRAKREMDWERADGIWGRDWSSVSYAEVARRYAAATLRPAENARKARALARSALTVADVKAIRELYLEGKRREARLAAAGALELTRIGAAIDEIHGGSARGKKYLARLDRLEARLLEWVESSPAVESMGPLETAVARLRREALIMDNPLLCERLLFVKRDTFHSSHFYTDFIDGCGRYGGNLCVLDLKTGAVTDLIPEMKDGIFGRFDLHFGATRVAFDWKKSPREGFRIYEVGIDPETGARVGAVRQLTFPPEDEQARIEKYDNSFLGGTARMYYHQTDDMHPCYLPDGGIVFVSTRCEYGTLCDAPDALSTAVIHRIDGDGKNMVKLTNSAVSEFSPSMLSDGRILYTRWEYVDKGQLGIKCLWAMRPDGSGTVEIYGNDIHLPPTFLHGRQIPGEANEFVFLGTPHYPQSGIGTVIRADMTRNIRTRDPMTYITPHVDIRQEPGWNHLVDGKWVRHTRGPLYMDPYPLNRSTFLVAHNRDRPWDDPKAYGIYLLTESGIHELIHEERETSCWQPYPLRARKTPPLLPCSADPGLAKKDLAVCMVQDVHHGMEGIERGEVKYIRVMEQLPRPWDARRFWDDRNRDNDHTRLVSDGTALAAKVMWGIVPVEKDGSAHFYVPANRNIYFQALDENYMELQRERTYVNYMPGEVRSCVGCHETPNTSPSLVAGRPIAFDESPVMPGPQPGDRTGKQVIHFPSYAQPVLDRYCVRCHGAEEPEGGLVLTGELTTHFSLSYENLIERGAVSTYAEASDWDGSPYAPPKSIGSHRSKLIAVLRQGEQHGDLDLPEEAFVRLATWVDASGVYYGSYWGRRHIKYKDHPFFRPVPTFEEAISTKCPVPVTRR